MKIKNIMWISAAVILVAVIVNLTIYKDPGFEAEQRTLIENEDAIKPSHKQATPRSLSKEVNERESWVDKMVSGRPESFQKVLDQTAPKDIHFDPPKRMSFFSVTQREIINYENQNQSRRDLVINGKPLLKSKMVDMRGDENFLMCGIRGKDIEIRLIQMHNKTEGDVIEILPKLNYHERRRWWIQSWNIITDTEFLGSSYEEDGEAEGVVMSHFYLYDRDTRTLRTLLPPTEVNPYQVLDIKGINRKNRVIKISDQTGEIYFMAF